MRVHFTIILLLSLLATSCLKEEYDQTSFREQLVVEGSITNGRSAEVMLSLNMDHRDDFTQEDIINRVVRYAYVTVSDGSATETLACFRDAQYPTQFVYKGVDIVGEVGKRYTLNIKYSGREWSAVTTIPEPEELHDIRTEWVRDTLYRLTATIRPQAADRHYMIRCAAVKPEAGGSAVQRPSYLYPALFGIIDSGMDEHRLTINRALDYAHITDYTTLFHKDEEVYLAFSSIPREGYAYWSVWENCIVNSLNPFFPVDENPPSNIVGGAHGIWCGYGSTYYIIRPQ